MISVLITRTINNNNQRGGSKLGNIAYIYSIDLIISWMHTSPPL